MTAQDHITTALDLLGNRTGCEPAKVHALLAIAEAIRETEPATSRAVRHARDANDHAAQLARVADALVQRLREARGQNTQQDALSQ